VTAVPFVGLSAAPVLAQAPSSSFTVVARDFRFSGVPRVRSAGTYSVTFVNRSQDDHDFVAVNLGPQCGQSVRTKKDAKSLKQRLDAAPDPEAAFTAACPGGSFEGGAGAGPGGRDTEDFTLTPGKTLYFCAVVDEHGAHSDLGMIGFITVRGLKG
jgi:plastocyanin